MMASSGVCSRRSRLPSSPVAAVETLYPCASNACRKTALCATLSSTRTTRMAAWGVRAARRLRMVSRKVGANAFLAVPYDAPTFRETIRNLLAARTPQAAMRVVLVEDSVAQSAVLRHAFEAQGYKVSTAATGEEGRRLLREQTPELAIIDYYLPDMMGDQLLREFVRPESSMVTIVMTTASAPEVA